MGRSQIFTINCTVLLQEKKKSKMFYKEPLYGLFLNDASRFRLLLGGFLVCLFFCLLTQTTLCWGCCKNKCIFKSVHSKIVNKLICFLWIRKWSKLYLKSSSSREIPCGSLLFSWCLSLYAQQYRKTKFRWICFI